MDQVSFARGLLQKCRNEMRELGAQSQSLMVMTDLHNEEEREKMLAVGRRMGIYAQLRVRKTLETLLVACLSPDPGIHISFDEIIQYLVELGRGEVIRGISRSIVIEEADRPLYTEMADDLKRQYEAQLLSE